MATVQELLSDIRKHSLVLPEFQREYVWTKEQAKQLMVSLINSYPVGSLLFWKTDDPPDLKNLHQIPETLGAVEVILDGQQRLTTLYLLLEGEIPFYYTEDDVKTDPRDLYFNLENGDFQYYQATRMRDNPIWWSVMDCFEYAKREDDINVFEIAQQVFGDAKAEPFQLAQLFNRNLNALRQIKNADMPVQQVPSRATIDDAIDIFDRVNSQGTKLTDAELALTHIVGKWPDARRQMKAKIDELAQRDFYYDLTFMTRALNGVVTQRAEFHHIHEEPAEKLIPGWKQLSQILDYLVTVLPDQAYVDSTEDLNTNNVIVPLVVYLTLNENRFPSQHAVRQATHWLYAAHTWSRYTAQTDQRLEHDLSLIVRMPEPWAALRDQIVDQRGRIKVKGNDLEGRGVRHPLYRMMYILAKAHGAVDWFNGAPLGKTHGDAYRIHNHHIFPSSLLYKKGYDPDNHLARKIVNEIANRAILTADTNIDLSNIPPVEYLPMIEENYPGALAAQFIPLDPELWRVENYPYFLAERRELVAQKFNEFMDALIAEPTETHERHISELIELGESATLEFKSTLQWDVIQSQMNKRLRDSVLKTIGAFLNSSGGTLVIGVEDNGSIYGLEQDLKTLGSDQSLDRFEQTLVNIIADRIGSQYSIFIKTRFEQLNGKSVCVVDVDKAPEPASVRTSKGNEFFVRVGNTTRSLDPQEAISYSQMNWE